MYQAQNSEKKKLITTMDYTEHTSALLKYLEISKIFLASKRVVLLHTVYNETAEQAHL